MASRRLRARKQCSISRGWWYSRSRMHAGVAATATALRDATAMSWPAGGQGPPIRGMARAITSPLAPLWPQAWLQLHRRARCRHPTTPLRPADVSRRCMAIAPSHDRLPLRVTAAPAVFDQVVPDQARGAAGSCCLHHHLHLCRSQWIWHCQWCPCPPRPRRAPARRRLSALELLSAVELLLAVCHAQPHRGSGSSIAPQPVRTARRWRTHTLPG
jgi:hypothetical protein